MANLQLSITNFPKEIIQLMLNDYHGADFANIRTTCKLWNEIIESTVWFLDIKSYNLSCIPQQIKYDEYSKFSNCIIYIGKNTNYCPNTVIIPSINNIQFQKIVQICPFILNILKRQFLNLQPYNIIGHHSITTKQNITSRSVKIYGPDYIDTNLANTIVPPNDFGRYCMEYIFFKSMRQNPIVRHVMESHKIYFVFNRFINKMVVIFDSFYNYNAKKNACLSYYGSNHPNIKKRNRITFYRKEYHNFSSTSSKIYCVQHNIPNPHFPKFTCNRTNMSIKLYTKYIVTQDLIKFINEQSNENLLTDIFSLDQVIKAFDKNNTLFFTYYNATKRNGNIIKSHHQENPYGVYIEPECNKTETVDNGWHFPEKCIPNSNNINKSNKSNKSNLIPQEKEYKFIKQGTYCDLVMFLYNDKVKNNK